MTMNVRDTSNYWTESRLSRRRVLGGAAVVGAGAVGAALVRCGGGGNGGTPTTRPTGDGTTAARPQKGGTFRSGAGNTGPWRTFDADRNIGTPVGTILGYTNLGLLHYRSFNRAELEGAFATKWEQPDTLTLNLTLREPLSWHDKPPVNGRPATVDDIVQFITRNKEGKLRDGTPDREFFRQEQYAVVDSVRAVDARTVSIRFNRPEALFLGTLAAGSAKIQAPEAVAEFETEYSNPRAEQVIGTGPYVLKSFSPDGFYAFDRFDKFYTDVWIDRIEYFPTSTDPGALQQGFEVKRFDTFSTPATALFDDMKATYTGQTYETTAYSPNPIAGTHYRGAPPWNNENLYGAIFRTIDRQKLIRDLFRGRGAMAGNIPPSQQAFAITETELATMPGYLANHDDDLTEAKKMWAAGGGPALGRVVIDIPDIWEGAFSGVADSILGMLKANFGDVWDAKIENYDTILVKILDNQYGNGRNNLWFGWISDVDDPEPSISLWQTYNSASQRFPQLGMMKLDLVDELTNKLITELEQGKRIELCREVERELLKHHGGGIAYLVNQTVNTLNWNYYHIGEAAPFGTAHQFGTQYWYDQNDPTWQGRP